MITNRVPSSFPTGRGRCRAPAVGYLQRQGVCQDLSWYDGCLWRRLGVQPETIVDGRQASVARRCALRPEKLVAGQATGGIRPFPGLPAAPLQYPS